MGVAAAKPSMTALITIIFEDIMITLLVLILQKECAKIVEKKLESQSVLLLLQ